MVVAFSASGQTKKELQRENEALKDSIVKLSSLLQKEHDQNSELRTKLNDINQYIGDLCRSLPEEISLPEKEKTVIAHDLLPHPDEKPSRHHGQRPTPRHLQKVKNHRDAWQRQPTGNNVPGAPKKEAFTVRSIRKVVRPHPQAELFTRGQEAENTISTAMGIRLT